ncbi:YihY family inner membrane protein [Pseudooceanicola sp. LIPI14-2-Ac024]|uniref:YihY family inner membrane protein n=1 Tax=Pseudooceanicola sp. LIPI14-2-Ac024 TaxID=3344875 RepID=UPI0035CEB816
MSSFAALVERGRTSRVFSAVMDVVNFALYTVRRFFADRIDNAVAALTYTSLLALVPLMVIAFAILSNFEAFDAATDRMEEIVFDAIVPEAGAVLTDYLADFTHNAGNLTTVGVIGLGITALFLLSTIESTLNHIWRVERTRPFYVRFLVFWAILTLGPLMIGVSLTLTSDAVSMAAEFQPSIYGVSQYAPGVLDLPSVQKLGSIVITTIGLTALYVIVPARPVLIRHAVVGALASAIGFAVLAWVFNSFLFSGSTYKTIYGAVAAVPIFLIWVYSSWVVVVLGAIVAASLPDWRHGHSPIPDADQTPGERLEAAIMLLAELQRQALKGGTIHETDLMAATTLEARSEVFEDLAAKGYLVETESGGVALVRDLHATTLWDLARDIGVTLGRAGAADASPVVRDTGAVHRLLQKLGQAEADVLSVPIADLVGPRDAGTSATVLRSTGSE